MDEFLEQRYAIKLCVKLGKNGAETLKMLRKAYGDDAMKQSQTFMWHKRFLEGRDSIKDDDRSRRHIDITNARLGAKRCVKFWARTGD